MLTGGIDFTRRMEVWKSGDATSQFGVFVQSIIDFIIIAFAIFMALRLLNKLNRKEEEVVEEPYTVIDTKEELLKEIRDLLKKEQAK